MDYSCSPFKPRTVCDKETVRQLSHVRETANDRKRKDKRKDKRKLHVVKLA